MIDAISRTATLMHLLLYGTSYKYLNKIESFYENTNCIVLFHFLRMFSALSRMDKRKSRKQK